MAEFHLAVPPRKRRNTWWASWNRNSRRRGSRCTTHTPAYRDRVIHTEVGDAERAIDALEEAIKLGGGDSYSVQSALQWAQNEQDDPQEG